MPEATKTKAEPTAQADNGLGFSEFLQVGREALTTQDDKKAAPAKAEPKTEAKPTEPAPDDPKAEKPKESEAKPEADDPAALKAKLETTEKRRKDAERNYQKEHQAKLELQKKLESVNDKLEVLDKKISGTYEDPGPKSETEAKREAVESEQRARMEEKAKLSIALATKEFGAETIKAKLLDEDAPWRELEKNPQVMTRVWAADSPFHEAMTILQEEEVFTQYGTRNVTDLLAKDRAKMKETLKQELLAELKGEAPNGKPPSPPTTLGTVRGGANSEKRTAGEQKPLDAMMPHLS